MTRPLFSILIPSRNRPELLRRAVASVLAQDADLEIIIADNASDPPYDSFVASLGPVAANSVRSDVPLPVTENWNRAAAMARGRYVLMLGDDDAIAPGWLARARDLIYQFDEPDVIYAMAYHYAYPGVISGQPSGYLATVDNSVLFRASERPYLLPQAAAHRLGVQALRFRHWFSFNSQHFLWSRAFIESASVEGAFFHGPYPDYFAAMVTMLSARRVVVTPTPEVIIGISPKSFGYFYNNDQVDAGRAMLGDDADHEADWSDASEPIRSAIRFPGSAHLRNWLIAALLVCKRTGLAEPAVVDLRRYRRLQILEAVSAQGERSARMPVVQLKSYLTASEARLLSQLDWFKRIARRTSAQPETLGALNAMGAIYTQANVTSHDIGEHESILDAFHWLDSKGSHAARESDDPTVGQPGESEIAASNEPQLHPLDPIARSAAGVTIAVVYLARSANGSVGDFDPFIASYRKHDAGIAHDLIILRKGLHDRAGAKAALAAMLEGVPHRAVDVSDEGFDIQAYLKLTPYLRHDRVCYLNTFSEIKVDGWLSKLNAPLDQPHVGLTGATGSYESLFTSLTFLSKVIWLTAARNIQYSPTIAKQFREILEHHARPWMAKRGSLRKRVLRELARPFLGEPIDSPEIEAGFAHHWDVVTKPGAVLHQIRDFKPFPNPHLRSNAFMIRRALLLELDFRLENTKIAANRFESGPDGLPTRLARRGLSSVLVGANGTAYDVATWPTSRTFRLGDQSNVTVYDNQVRAFAEMSAWQRAIHVRMTWGGYVPAPIPEPLDFGIKFPRGNLELVPAPAAEPVGEPTPKELSFSVVIPTRNRLALLRDAVDSVVRQRGENWECVVFDNASDEPIRDYVRSLGDPRVRYERSDEFLPVTASWNRAIDLARGDYVTLLGDDDGLVPGYFKRLTELVAQFQVPEVIYSALYQFIHPTVAPWERAGYVIDMRSGFFFKDQADPFVLSPSDARNAVDGSLNLRRNFTFNMQAFAFRRSFLERIRTNGEIFRSPFPDYYLANVAMGLAARIVVSPQPLAVAGVSRASFGYTLFNNLEEKGAAMLNSSLPEDDYYRECAPFLLPGPAYNTNYVITMKHVSASLKDRGYGDVDLKRYRRLQTFSLITAQTSLLWMRSDAGSRLWSRLSARERAGALKIGIVNWRAKKGNKDSANALERLQKEIEPYGVKHIESNRAVGCFAVLPELLDALESGAYPRSTVTSSDVVAA